LERQPQHPLDAARAALDDAGVLMRALSEGIQAVTAALYEREKK
jgi:hypothetical protein